MKLVTDINVKLPSSLKAKVQAEAKARGLNKSNIVRDALRFYFERKK